MHHERGGTERSIDRRRGFPGTNGTRLDSTTSRPTAVQVAGPLMHPPFRGNGKRGLSGGEENNKNGPWTPRRNAPASNPSRHGHVPSTMCGTTWLDSRSAVASRVDERRGNQSDPQVNHIHRASDTVLSSMARGAEVDDHRLGRRPGRRWSPGPAHRSARVMLSATLLEGVVHDSTK